MSDDEEINVVFGPDLFEIIILKEQRVSCSGKLIITHNKNGRKRVINTDKVLYAYVTEKEAY